MPLARLADDAMLGDLSAWTDAGWWTDRTRRVLGADAERLERATPFYLRLKRGTSVAAGLSLEWADSGSGISWASMYLASRERVAEAARKAETLRVVAPPHGPVRASTADPPAAFLAFPNDLALRGLGAAADPRRLKNRLHDPATGWPADRRVIGSRSRLFPLRWKPGRRAVLHAELAPCEPRPGVVASLDAIVRVVPLVATTRQAARWHAAGLLSSLRAPRVLAVDTARGLIVTEFVPGRAVQDAAEAEASARVWKAALAHAFAASATRAGDPRLAAPMVPWRSDAEDLAPAVRTLSELAAWRPATAVRVTALADRMAAAGEALAPATPVLTHGDMHLGQWLRTRDGWSLLDWDETAWGDPHADLASLAVDVALTGGHKQVPAWASEMAAGALGFRFDHRRWRWQLAAAWARRALSGLQRARPDWGALAEDALEAAAGCLRDAEARPAFAGAGRSSPPVPAGSRGRGRPARHEDSGPPFDVALRELADPAARRRYVPRGQHLVLAAAWPERDAAILRFERAVAPGAAVRWLRLERLGSGEGRGATRISAFPFPSDPALPRLAAFASEPAARVLGHRLGRRAAVWTERRPGAVLHLRPARIAAARHAFVSGVGAALANAGVPVAETLEFDAAADGWWSRLVAGPGGAATALETDSQPAIGAALARAHETPPPGWLPVRGLIDAARASARQVSFAVRLGGPFADWLGATHARWAAAAAALGSDRRAPEFVHGDFHPAQVVAGIAPVLLDWERAAAGEPEEDLGNWWAHLAWERPNEAAAASGACFSAYRNTRNDRASTISRDRLRVHAALALLRVIAIHAWRDDSRARATDPARWAPLLEDPGPWLS